MELTNPYLSNIALTFKEVVKANINPYEVFSTALEFKDMSILFKSTYSKDELIMDFIDVTKGEYRGNSHITICISLQDDSVEPEKYIFSYGRNTSEIETVLINKLTLNRIEELKEFSVQKNTNLEIVQNTTTDNKKSSVVKLSKEAYINNLLDLYNKYTSEYEKTKNPKFLKRKKTVVRFLYKATS